MDITSAQNSWKTIHTLTKKEQDDYSMENKQRFCTVTLRVKLFNKKKNVLLRYSKKTITMMQSKIFNDVNIIFI